MKKKTKLNYLNIIIVFSIIVIIVISIIVFNLIKNNKYSKETKEFDNFGRIIGIWEKKPTKEEYNQRKEKIDKLLASGEETADSTEMEDDYFILNVITPEQKKDYYIGYKQTKTIGLLVEAVMQYFGYEMLYNNIEISDSRVKIDFKLTSAPFNIDNNSINTNITKDEKLREKKDLCYSMLDSLTSTIKTNFGKNIKVYYTINGKDIEVNDIDPKLTLKKNVEYKYLIEGNK